MGRISTIVLTIMLCLMLQSTFGQNKIVNQKNLESQDCVSFKTNFEFNREKGCAITAPSNGVIVKILVTVGQSVKQGDVLIVMKAMGMEQNIVAEISGIIVHINVEVGSVVEWGDNLIGINEN